MHAELLFNLDDFERYLWKFGDGTANRSADLTRLIDGDAELDEDFKISLGDIVLAIDVDMALLALPLTKNRRLNLKVIWLTVQGFTYQSENKVLRAAVKTAGKWIDGDDDASLDDVKATCVAIRRDIQSGKMPAIETSEIVFGDIATKAPTFDITAILEWCVDYARGVEEREDNNEYYNSPRYIVDMIKQMFERDRYKNDREIDTLLTARIVHMSPPFAIVGSGHSAGYTP